MSCHQTAGFPAVAIEPAFSPLAPVVGLDDAAGHQDFQMAFFGNVPTGVVFGDSQLYSTDYSLQLSMSLQNFASVRCAPDAAEKPAICGRLTAWADAQRQAIDDLLAFGRPKAN
jgi:hypothetical protein